MTQAGLMNLNEILNEMSEKGLDQYHFYDFTSKMKKKRKKMKKKEKKENNEKTGHDTDWDSSNVHLNV